MADGILYTSNGSAVITVGANLVNQRITNSVSIDNNKNIRFQTVNTASYVGMRQQNDDNFVFYSTNTAYGERAIWSVFANSITSAFSVSSPTIFNANINLGQVAVTANSSTGSAGQVLTTNGSSTYWSTVSGSGSVNTAAQFAWTNIHTFSANVSFTGNGIGITTNTGAIYLGGLADNNWKIGRNTGSTTKWRYTNNSIDIITANSNLEGMSIGLINGNSYFETGYLGTFIASNVTIGNTTVNVTINSTSFTGTASNASLLNNKTEGNLNVNNATTAYSKAESALNVNSALTANNSTNLGGQAASYYTNATNITTGTLPYAQIPANVINTTAAFTRTGITTFSANVVLGSSGLSANGGFGTAGQVLHSNGTAAYWAADDNAGGTVTSVATGNGMTGGTITTTGTVSILANTGVVANATGLFVNATYIGTISANNASFLGGTAAASYALLAGPTFTGTVNVSSGNFYSNNLLLQGDGTDAYIRPINSGSVLYLGANNNNHLSLVANGNLGVGTSSPSYKLHTSYSGGTASPSALYRSAVFFADYTRSDNSQYVGRRVAAGATDYASFLQAEDGGAAVMPLALNPSGGNVGIGTTSPAYRLEVNGSFAATTTGQFGGNVAIAGIATLSANVVLGTTTITANGGVGTAGQVLTSGATGNVYWAAAAGGGYYKGGSATVGTLAAGGQNLFRVNANTLNFNTTIAAGENAQATGPIAVAAGITLTVASGARVAIV